MLRVAESLHPKQAAFAASRAKRLSGCCGRRAGKTVAVLAWLVLGGAMYPGELSGYTALTVGRARAILEPAVYVLERATGVQLRWQTRSGLLYLVCPNGHRIWVGGCPNRSYIQAWRGNPLVRWAGDESFALDAWLAELVEEAISPALMDFDGESALIGTPGSVPVGFFYGATTGDGDQSWERHHWDARDNVYLPHATEWLAAKRTQMGWEEDDPTYLREYLGVWAQDFEQFCYPCELGRNTYLELPSGGDWQCAIAVDPGVVDDAAMVLLRWRYGWPDVFVDDEFSRPGLSPSELGAFVQQWRHRYNPAFVVADTGGIGRAFTQEWAVKLGLLVHPASKADVRGQIAMMAGEMKLGHLKAHAQRCRRLIAQWQTIAWDEKRRAPDERYEDHLADAARYGFMAVRTEYRPVHAKPQPGTPEWAAEIDNIERDLMLRDAAKRQARGNREFTRQLQRRARRAA